MNYFTHYKYFAFLFYHYQHHNYIMSADDITQIITHPSKSKIIMALQTHDAIKSINEFKKRWKIKRNATKFQMISAAKLSPLPITINNTDTSFILQGNSIYHRSDH